ncbi:PHP domain-containing protein [Leptolyngbya sp. FACHB-711]|uniref:PHP domain-containing protein n=1 Tax=unclassified Leptolyngbya TaxID=2650499 RepID=UPI001688A8BD|nr:PHP domain-containing protein [Leptolyngbya sp. FACHB-711]MBD1849890.1 PHP domain-containing protein [Cyanobacteria bacterium FACHB-502]MBD2023644.1 PHP domain-containing protein [Leptolyngbya sp. FACHB-711]
MLELHCHTTCSDGTLTPTQLVWRAHQAGVRALAITDHDTLQGWDEAFAAAANLPIEIVPGLELSTVYNDRSMHILGFYPDRQKLQAPLRERLNGRKRRAQLMLAKLAELGYPIALPERGEGMAPGRPHIASAMVRAGYVTSSEEAFDRFLGSDKPAYVEYEKFSAIEGIQLLRSCGGVPVWAHPYLFRGGTVETVLPVLVEAGLMGIEVYHPSHSSSEVRRLEESCAYYGLLKTGGSDYHGPSPTSGKDTHGMLNSEQVSLSLLAPLKQAAQKIA